MILLDSDVVNAKINCTFRYNDGKCMTEQTVSSDVVGVVNCWILSIDAFGQQQQKKRLLLEKI